MADTSVATPSNPGAVESKTQPQSSDKAASERAAMVADNPDGDVFKTEMDLKTLLRTQEQFADEIAQKTAMVSDPEKLSVLEEEYRSDKKIVARINELMTTYDQLRKTRPDGNSFYRAFAFSYLESLRHDIDELMNAQDIIRRAREDLVCLGYPLFSFEIFYDVIYHVLKSIRHGITKDDLYSFFNHPLVSDSIVAYFRLITSAHIKLDSEYYTNFYKWDKKTLDTFCAKEVEAMNVEAEDIQMTALAARFGIAIRVEYVEPQHVLELTWGKPVERIRIKRDFVEGWDPRVYLLARPGQFDVLYKPSTPANNAQQLTN